MKSKIAEQIHSKVSQETKDRVKEYSDELVINQFESHFDQYWDMVKDVIDNTEGWVYSNDVPHILDYYFEANTGKEIEFQKIWTINKGRLL